ncbi:MAG: glycogen debranching enzyme family protein [Bacteroidales bacterium]|nr:glycogen debranching enzyme family protein [Bacteroidales bacterium]
MNYLKFDKQQLINLEYSLSKEILRSNRAGAFANTTIIGCNTRKYHGLLICPVEQIGGKHVLLSSLDVTIIQHGKEFNIGIHKYQGNIYEPGGHKYVRDFETETIPGTIIRVGGVVLSKERLLVENTEQILIRYTLLESHSETRLRFKPFLAFRNTHSLSKANMDANTKIEFITNGIKSKLYANYPYLHMQFSKNTEFIPVPDWYYNIEYAEEQARGYDYKEDLFVPGYFEMAIKNGESIVFSGSTVEVNPAGLKRKFTIEEKKRVPRNDFRNCLINAAQQFIVRKKERTEIIAGFPWFDSWGRDTFISLPGLTLSIDDSKTCKAVLDTQISMLKEGLFPNMGTENDLSYNSVDAPLWFSWAVQKYVEYIDDDISVWKRYGPALKSILKAYRDGTGFNIKMQKNGLVYAGEEGKALTWMDAIVDGKPVTQRKGYAVEINALWYNAVMFSLELAEKAKDEKFIESWKNIPEIIRESFLETFYCPEKSYLADYVDGEYKDLSVRPNQVFAVSLKYSPLNDEIKEQVLKRIKKELMTPRGLRTLSPKSPDYKGIYEGNQEQRDKAYHQGTVWPWLLGHFCEGYLKIYKERGVEFVSKLIEGFEEVICEHGISSISEIYDGNPPHKPKGAISQAWSVAEILRIMRLIEKYK